MPESTCYRGMTRIRVDDLLSRCGSSGLFHVVFYCMIFSMNFYIGGNYAVFHATFAIVPKNIRCKPSSTYLEHFDVYQKNISIDDLQFHSCTVSLKSNITQHIVKCKHWVYNDGDHGVEESIIIKWDLVCDKKYYPMLAITTFFIGVFCGGMITGYISDRFGRRPTLLSFLLLSIVFAVASIFSPDYYTYIVARFVSGIFFSGVQITLNVLCMEMTSRKDNTFIGLSLIFSFFVSLPICAAIAWAVKTWWQIQLAFSLPFVITFILGYFLLPESFRWCIAHNKMESLKKYLALASKLNKVSILDDETKEMLELSQQVVIRALDSNGDWTVGGEDVVEKEDIGFNKEMEASKAVNKNNSQFSVIFHHPEIRKRLVLICIILISIQISFYTLHFNAGQLSENPYMIIMIGAAIDLIPLFIAFVIMKRTGKRRLAICYHGFAAISCIVYFFAKHIALMLMGKMFVGVAFGLAVLLSIELFPTTIRNICCGMAIGISRIGGIIAPQFLSLGSVSGNKGTPVLVVGGLLLICAVLTFFLTDTTNAHLPETIEDVDNFMANRKKTENDVNKYTKKITETESKNLV